MLVKDFLSKFIQQNTNGYVFGMSGANIEELMASILAHELKMIIAKNENNALCMAVGSFLKTKRLSTVVTTSGGGLLNIIPMVAEAFTSRNPCLIITGTPPTYLLGLGAFQETSGKNGTFDIQKLFDPITCSSHHITTPDEVPEAIRIAITKSIKYKRPAIIFIPSDFWAKNISKDSLLNSDKIQYEKKTKLDLLTVRNSMDLFFQKIKENEKPILVFGNEINSLTETKNLFKIINSKNCLQIGLPETKGFFDHYAEQFIGLIGIMGHSQSFEKIKQSNHIVFVGLQANTIEVYDLKDKINNKNILCLNEFDNYWNPNDALILRADLNALITHLSHYLSDYKSKQDETKDGPYPSLGHAHFKKVPFNLKTVMEELNKLLPKGADLFIDAGNTGASAISFLKPQQASLLYISLGMGAMGNSIGVALGSKLCSKENQHTFVIIGDGSFLISGLEIHTAIEYDISVNFIIINNNAHEMCKTREKIFGAPSNGKSINDFKKTDYAKGFKYLFPKLNTFDVYGLEELQGSMQAIMNLKGPNLISINITSEITPPFRSFKPRGDK